MEKKNRIVLGSMSQAILFEYKLKHLLSQGMIYSETEPLDHAKDILKLDVRFTEDESQLGVEGFPVKVKYNFDTKAVKEHADDMIKMVKFFSVCPTYPKSLTRDVFKVNEELAKTDLETIEGIYNKLDEINKKLEEVGSKKISVSRFRVLRDLLGRFKKYDVTQDKLEAMIELEYTEADLENDLKAITKVFQAAFKNGNDDNGSKNPKVPTNNSKPIAARTQKTRRTAGVKPVESAAVNG